MAFRYALRLEDGGDAGDVGTFTTAAPDWHVGDVFFDREHKRWRILRILVDAEPSRGRATSTRCSLSSPVSSTCAALARLSRARVRHGQDADPRVGCRAEVVLEVDGLLGRLRLRRRCSHELRRQPASCVGTETAPRLRTYGAFRSVRARETVRGAG